MPTPREPHWQLCTPSTKTNDFKLVRHCAKCNNNTKNRLHACPAIYQDRRHATLAGPQSVAVPLMRPLRVISPPLACRFLLLFSQHNAIHKSCWVWASLWCPRTALPLSGHVSGNFAISYRRSHRRFLCTSQWSRLAAHCGPAKHFLWRCLLSAFFNYQKVHCTFILQANYEN